MAALSRDLDLLSVTQKELKESLSPVDMKSVNQRVWQLQQQHGDLDLHLDLAIYQLQDKLSLGHTFDKRSVNLSPLQELGSGLAQTEGLWVV